MKTLYQPQVEFVVSLLEHRIETLEQQTDVEERDDNIALLQDELDKSKALLKYLEA